MRVSLFRIALTISWSVYVAMSGITISRLQYKASLNKRCLNVAKLSIIRDMAKDFLRFFRLDTSFYGLVKLLMFRKIQMRA